MTKIRKYNGVYKLPIKKHTKVRRPVSRYKVLLNIGSPVLFRNDIDVLVSDVYTKLENPLFTGAYEYAKPSLLTRVRRPDLKKVSR